MKICAPFAGTVRFLVADGDQVDTGAPLAVVEAMKLEAPVLAPGPGMVRRSIHEDFISVTGGDELLELVGPDVLESDELGSDETGEEN